MKLLVLTTQDSFFLTHIIDRADYFQEKGWQVAVAVQVTDASLVGLIKKQGFLVFDTRIERQSTNLLKELLVLFRLLKFYFTFKPDLVWHLGAKSIAYGTLSALLLRVRQSVGIINAPIGLGFVYASDSFKAKVLRPILNLLYKFFLNPKHSRVIIENYDDIRLFVRRKYLNRKDAFCILGAGVDTDKFSPGEEKKNECTVVMASQLIKEKGVWDFVKAAEVLKKLNVPVKMQLVGSPDYGNPSSISEKDFEALKKNPNIDCLGYRQDMENVLKQADVFCLPSFYREGLPRALVEASSCGLALLTTNVVGCKEAVRENNGFLFQPHDVDRLVYLIKYLVEHPEERVTMGQQSRKVALSYFDTKKICKRTYDIFLTLM